MDRIDVVDHRIALAVLRRETRILRWPTWLEHVAQQSRVTSQATIRQTPLRNHQACAVHDRIHGWLSRCLRSVGGHWRR